MKEKDLGADAAAVETAEPVASDAATARHTPGPWEVRGQGGNMGNVDSYAVIETSDSRWVVADVWADIEELAERVDANAHLIAAAPELLDACRQLTEFAKRQGWFHVAIEAGLAAIAKAEGR